MTNYTTCPRCGQEFTDTELPDKYHGALSLIDNQTPVCDDCAEQETQQKDAGYLTDTTGYFAWAWPPVPGKPQPERALA